MNKFATVYKYAMDKQAEHNKAYVDSIRRKTPEWINGEYNPEPENAEARWSYLGNHYGTFPPTPGFIARSVEVMEPDYDKKYSATRAWVNASTSPLSVIRKMYPAVKPSHRPSVRRALNKEMHALRKQPAPTITSQLGNAFRDVYGKPIANAYNSVKDGYNKFVDKSGDAWLSAKDQIGKYMSRINPLRTTK